MKLKSTGLSVSILGALLASASAQFNTLAPWGNAVGTTPPPSFTSNGTTSTITAGGEDFWGDSDQGAYLYDNGGAFTTTGDFTATVRHVSTTTPAPEWGRDGILVRSTTGSTPGAPAANDPNFMAFRKSNGFFDTGIRAARGAGGTTENTNGINGPGVPTGNVSTTAWYMATARTGSTMQAGMAIDLNGTAGRWVLHSTQDGGDFAAGNQVIVGLGHQSHPQTISPDTNDINTATFDKWSYQGSYNAAFFGPAAGTGPNPWNVGGALNVNPNGGAITGRAYVTQNGAATGEATKWTVTASQVLPMQPGLRTNIFLANSNSLASARAVTSGTPNGTTVIPNVDWTGNGGTSATNAQQYNRGQTGDFSLAVPGSFAGADQNDYTVHMVGQIFIPSSANRIAGSDGNINTVAFKDGIDDYTYVAIDGVVLLDDNNWTGYNGVDNGGSPIVTLDVSNAKYGDGEWVSFEMIMSEGGGGDNGVLYWDQNAAGGFPAILTDPASTDAIVPGANFRHTPLGATQTAMGFTQVGTDLIDGSFGLTLPNGDWSVTLNVENTAAISTFNQTVTVVPEPSAPLFVALSGLALLLRRRRR